MSRRIPQRVLMLDAKATSVSSGVLVSDYRNCILSIVGSPDASLKVFVKGAVMPSDTDFTELSFNCRASARDSNNKHWDYIEVVDLEDGTAIDGDDGINLSGNTVRLIEVNINSLDWLAVESTAVVAGTVKVVGIFTTNQ